MGKDELRQEVERLSSQVSHLEGLVLSLASLVLLMIAADPALTSDVVP